MIMRLWNSMVGNVSNVLGAINPRLKRFAKPVLFSWIVFGLVVAGVISWSITQAMDFSGENAKFALLPILWLALVFRGPAIIGKRFTNPTIEAAPPTVDAEQVNLSAHSPQEPMQLFPDKWYGRLLNSIPGTFIEKILMIAFLLTAVAVAIIN